jgi:hypothetical protein
MDVLWAGLTAGWLRGVEALMSYVDPWTSAFQDAFTIMGAEIYKGWDALWTRVGGALNTSGAYLLGAFDNIINPILAMWDKLESGILKSWNYIQSFFKDGFDLEKENNKVDSEMTARARKREISRPGVDARVEKSLKENMAADGAMIRRRDAVDANTQETIAGRQAENQKRAADRRAATKAAEDSIGATSRKGRARRVMGEQYAVLLKEVENATSLDQLRDLYGQFDALSSNGRLTSSQSSTLDDALTDAQERISKATGSMSASPSQKAAAGGAAGAGAESAMSMGQVAGTFSSLNLGQAFGGTSLAERTAKAAEETAKNTRKIDDGGKVAA